MANPTYHLLNNNCEIFAIKFGKEISKGCYLKENHALPYIEQSKRAWRKLGVKTVYAVEDFMLKAESLATTGGVWTATLIFAASLYFIMGNIAKYLEWA